MVFFINVVNNYERMKLRILLMDMHEPVADSGGCVGLYIYVQVCVQSNTLNTCTAVGETGASCYRGRLLQGRFMQNYRIDGEIADSSCILIHQRNH